MGKMLPCGIQLFKFNHLLWLPEGALCLLLSPTRKGHRVREIFSHLEWAEPWFLGQTSLSLLPCGLRSVTSGLWAPTTSSNNG